MKTTTLCICIILISLLFNQQLSSNNLSIKLNSQTTDFELFDESIFYNEFVEIMPLEDCLLISDLSFNETFAINPNLLINVSPTMVRPDKAISPNEKVLGVPSFFWGCAFSVVGVIIIAFVAENRDETKKAVKGCLISSGIIAIVSIYYYVRFLLQIQKSFMFI